MFGKKSKHAKEMQNYIAKANSIMSTTKFTDQDKINKINKLNQMEMIKKVTLILITIMLFGCSLSSLDKEQKDLFSEGQEIIEQLDNYISSSDEVDFAVLLIDMSFLNGSLRSYVLSHIEDLYKASNDVKTSTEADEILSSAKNKSELIDQIDETYNEIFRIMSNAQFNPSVEDKRTLRILVDEYESSFISLIANSSDQYIQMTKILEQ